MSGNCPSALQFCPIIKTSGSDDHGYGGHGDGYGLLKNSPRPTRTRGSGLRGTKPADHAELHVLYNFDTVHH